jgi:hypothetical protein
MATVETTTWLNKVNAKLLNKKSHNDV